MRWIISVGTGLPDGPQCCTELPLRGWTVKDAGPYIFNLSHYEFAEGPQSLWRVPRDGTGPSPTLADVSIPQKPSSVKRR